MTQDYYGASLSQRYEAIQKLLSAYNITFTPTHHEEFKPHYKGGRPTIRQYYSVLIHKDRESETFPYFAPWPRLTRDWAGNGVKAPLRDKDKQERLVSFVSCLCLDYTWLDSEGIMDSLDYMKANGCTPQEAREQYASLRSAMDKLNKIFGHSLMTKLASIVEGY